MDVSEVKMVTESGIWLSVFSVAEVRIKVTELHPVTHSPFFHFPPNGAARENAKRKANC